MGMNTLVLIEHDGQAPCASSLATLTAARALGSACHALVVGTAATSVIEQVARLEGIARVHVCADRAFEEGAAEPIAELVLSLAGDYDALVGPATSWGKNIMPRIAASLDVMQISDIIEVLDASTFMRPIYAGNAIATVQSADMPKVITVRPTAFEKTVTGETVAPTETITFAPSGRCATFVENQVPEKVGPELSDARVVVSGGRGLGSAAQFKLIEALAQKLDAAVGASRAAVDAGFVSNDLQVGQTGKVVAPDLYFAIGISGAIQHVAGMKDSKIIVAINHDPNAPIFEVADYGLVGDLFTLIPELMAQL